MVDRFAGHRHVPLGSGRERDLAVVEFAATVEGVDGAIGQIGADGLVAGQEVVTGAPEELVGAPVADEDVVATADETHAWATTPPSAEH